MVTKIELYGAGHVVQLPDQYQSNVPFEIEVVREYPITRELSPVPQLGNLEISEEYDSR